jgi:hypothetical protein
LALVALARFMPGYGPGGDSWAQTYAALPAPNIAGTSDDAAAVLEYLADESVLPDLSSWTTALEELVREGWLKPEAVGPPPCVGRLVEVDVAGHPHPAAAIQTSVCVTDLTLTEAKQFLDPARWEGCCAFWCAMERKDDPVPDVQRYLEKVSLDCRRGPSLKTCIDFRRIDQDGVAILAYRMSDDQKGCGGDGEILVDEGSIEVREVDGHVCITTTKRVLFRADFTPGWTAGIVCPLGYADMGEQLVYCAGAGRPVPAGKGAKGSECVNLIDETAARAERCIDDVTSAYHAGYRKAAAGTYTPDDVARDMTGAWKRVYRDAGTMLDLGIRALRTAAAGADPSRDRLTVRAARERRARDHGEMG